MRRRRGSEFRTPRLYARPQKRSLRPQGTSARRTVSLRALWNGKTHLMSALTSVAVLLVFSTRPVVPPGALPQAVESDARPASPPAWLAQAAAVWRGPWIARPDLYDHRYITW